MCIRDRIDSGGSYVGFVIRHLMIAKIRGQFESVRGEIVTADDHLDSSVTVTIDAASFRTSDAVKNEQVTSSAFLDADHYPSLTFGSTGVHSDHGLFLIEGDLTIRGPVSYTHLAQVVHGDGRMEQEAHEEA